MGVFDVRYLGEAQIKGFDNYKYSSVDTSPLSNYVSHPFWNWVVKFYPEWLAPNVLTLSGFLLVTTCYFVISYIDYDLDGNTLSGSSRAVPNWIWLMAAICTFTAHTLDGTDGKQARRTGTSGPTGELFDHGLDSWSTVPFTITIFSIFGRGEFRDSIFSVPQVNLLCILISVQLVFIVTHWEKYNTGILYLSWGYDASQFGLAGFYLLTYFLEYEWYKFYVFDGITCARVFEAGFYVVCGVSLVMSAYNIYVSYAIDKTGRQNSLYEACLPMFSSVVLFSVSVLWARYSPGDVIALDPRSFFWAMGTVFSNIACRLIIAQMSHTRAEPFNRLLSMYCVIAFASLLGFFPPDYELLVLRVTAVGVTLAHLHYGICLVRQLCDHFKIEAFSLSYLEKSKRRDSAIRVFDLPRLDNPKAIGASSENSVNI